MQGRLSPPLHDRLQKFPWASWEEEFGRAASLGFGCIEWIFEAEGFEENPLWTDADRVRRVAEKHGVAVRSVCGDYFMPHPFFRVADAECDANVAILRGLIPRAAEVGARVVLVPVLEVSEIREQAEEMALVGALETCLDEARACGVRLGLETELPADRYEALVRRFDTDRVGVYFDIGNAAARGYDVATDAARLGSLVCGVHVKDRPRGGSSVPLGEGAADFRGCFAALARAGFEGPLILQTAFGADYLGFAARHLSFVREALAGTVAMRAGGGGPSGS